MSVSSSGPAERQPLDADPRVDVPFQARVDARCSGSKASRSAVSTVTRQPARAKALAVASARYTPPLREGGNPHATYSRCGAGCRPSMPLSSQRRATTGPVRAHPRD